MVCKKLIVIFRESLIALKHYGKLNSMIEGPKSNETTSVEQINHETMQEFLSKIAIWDYYEMTREECTSKNETIKNY